MKFRIAAAQIQSHQSDPHYNLKAISRICQKSEITEDPSTLVVFPELSVTGYFMHDDVFNLAEKELNTAIIFRNIAPAGAGQHGAGRGGTMILR